MTLTAGVVVAEDGSGTVRAGIGLDERAVRELGDPARELRLDDLEAAGWTVWGPVREPDGLTWVRVSKPFATPEDAARVAGELSGPEGPFREFRVERRRSLLRTTTQFTGVVDLTRGVGGLSDPALEERLGEDPALDVEGLRARFGDDLGQVVQVRVEARLPGGPGAAESNAHARRHGVLVWEPRLGEEVRLVATSERINVQPVLAAGSAVVLAAAAVVVLVLQRRRS